jgi:hypothetical protein
LKGEEIQENPCSEATYINSFFTTFGVESFSGPLGMDISTVNSQCTAQSVDGGNQGQNQQFDFDDDYVANNYEFQDYRAYTSYGTGCLASGDFAIKEYQGAFCHGTKALQTTDSLQEFNTKIKEFQCTQIYDASTSPEVENANVQAYNNAYDFENMDAINILSVSEACSLLQYPQDCPDPFGVKKQYDKAIQKSFYAYSTSRQEKIIDIMNISSIAALAAGIFFLVCAYFIKRTRDRNSKVRKQLRKEKKAKKEGKRKERPEQKKTKKVKESQQIEYAGVVITDIPKTTTATTKEQKGSKLTKLPLLSRFRRNRKTENNVSMEEKDGDAEEQGEINDAPIDSLPYAPTSIDEQEGQCVSMPEVMSACAFPDIEASASSEAGKVSKTCDQ